MSKRNSKSSNVSSVVVVCCTALKMGAFSSSCSGLCNEWSLMSSKSRVTLVQTKLGEYWDDAGEQWDGSHSGRSRPRIGDSVSYFHRRFSLPVNAWAALQIQALRASWDPLLDSNKRQLGPWSVENKTFARFSQHCPQQRRKQQHCRRQLGREAHQLETRRRSPYFHDRLGQAAALNPIDRSYSPQKKILEATPTGSLWYLDEILHCGKEYGSG